MTIWIITICYCLTMILFAFYLSITTQTKKDILKSWGETIETNHELIETNKKLLQLNDELIEKNDFSDAETFGKCYNRSY